MILSSFHGHGAKPLLQSLAAVQYGFFQLHAVSISTEVGQETGAHRPVIPDSVENKWYEDPDEAVNPADVPGPQTTLDNAASHSQQGKPSQGGRRPGGEYITKC